MKNIIYLEGCDCSGKTTLAQEFMANGYHYFHSTYFKGMNVEEAHLYTAKLIQETESDVVLDRGPLSEYVYGTTFRDSWYGIDVYNSIMKKIAPTKQILCAPQFDKVLKCFNDPEREEMFKSEDIEDIYVLYKEAVLLDDRFGEWEIYDYNKEGEV